MKEVKQNIDEARLNEIVSKAEILCKHLECDGTARVLHYLLRESNIEHKIIFGKMTLGRQSIPVHYWIELSDGLIIDLKARMWVESDKAPHGIFNTKTTDANYIKYEVVTLAVTKFIFEILTRNH